MDKKSQLSSKMKTINGAASESVSVLPPSGREGGTAQAMLLCKGLCHCGRQRDGDSYRMQMGVEGDGDE